MQGVELIDLPRHSDRRGSLVAVEGGAFLPFEVRRVFFIWDVPQSVARAEDSMSAHEALVALQGEVTIDLDNGREKLSIRLSRPDQALCVHAGVWLRMRDFSPQAMIMAASSKKHADTERFSEPKPDLLGAPWGEPAD